MSSHPDNDIINRVRAGDQSALGAVHAEHYARLVRYAERITGVPETANDIVQDVFLNIWAKREKWSVRNSIAAYLYAAVRGIALRKLRHDRVEQRHQSNLTAESFAAGGLFGVASPEDDVSTTAMLEVVYHVLDGLPVRCREAFVLYRENGLELSEVAQVMGTSVGTAKVQIRRAVAALRDALAPYTES